MRLSIGWVRLDYGDGGEGRAKENLTKYSPANPPIPTASISTSANPTPPSLSPHPSCSIPSCTKGNTARHDAQYDAVHSVSNGRCADAERRRRVLNWSVERILGGVSVGGGGGGEGFTDRRVGF